MGICCPHGTSTLLEVTMWPQSYLKVVLKLSQSGMGRGEVVMGDEEGAQLFGGKF